MGREVWSGLQPSAGRRLKVSRTEVDYRRGNDLRAVRHGAWGACHWPPSCWGHLEQGLSRD